MCGGLLKRVIDVIVVLSQYYSYLNIPLISYLAGSARRTSEEEKTAAEIENRNGLFNHPEEVALEMLIHHHED